MSSKGRSLRRGARSTPRLALTLALGIAAIGLSACSSSTFIDAMPASVGGLAQGTPARPLAPPDYPAVHDMPPARTEPTLSEDEQKKIEDDLMAARSRQETRTGTSPKKKIIPAASATDTVPAGAAQKP